MIEEYFQKIIKQISKFSLVTSVEINTVLGSKTKGHITAIIKFDNDSELHLFEFVTIVQEEVVKIKYRYHWQDASKKLIMRWDNAKHHPGLKTFPNHVHVQDEENVQSHDEINLNEVLKEILDFLIKRERSN